MKLWAVHAISVRWPNVAQIDQIVVVVIVVVVAVIVDLLRRYCFFSKSVTDTQIHTHKQTHIELLRN